MGVENHQKVERGAERHHAGAEAAAEASSKFAHEAMSEKTNGTGASAAKAGESHKLPKVLDLSTPITTGYPPTATGSMELRPDSAVTKKALENSLRFDSSQSSSNGSEAAARSKDSVPDGGTGADAQAAKLYQIKAGDKLWNISKKALADNGNLSPSAADIAKSTSEIAKGNSLPNPDVLSVGKTLNVSSRY